MFGDKIIPLAEWCCGISAWCSQQMEVHVMVEMVTLASGSFLRPLDHIPHGICVMFERATCCPASKSNLARLFWCAAVRQHAEHISDSTSIIAIGVQPMLRMHCQEKMSETIIGISFIGTPLQSSKDRNWSISPATTKLMTTWGGPFCWWPLPKSVDMRQRRTSCNQHNRWFIPLCHMESKATSQNKSTTGCSRPDVKSTPTKSSNTTFNLLLCYHKKKRMAIAQCTCLLHWQVVIQDELQIKHVTAWSSEYSISYD